MSLADLIVVALLAYLAGYGVGRWDNNRRWMRTIRDAQVGREARAALEARDRD